MQFLKLKIYKCMVSTQGGATGTASTAMTIPLWFFGYTFLGAINVRVVYACIFSV